MQTIQKVAAVCVNWNGGDSLRATLESLLASDYPGLKIVVVDNASTDDSTDNMPGEIDLLRLERNTGYGEALNQGIKYLEKKHRENPALYFLALNNDISLEPGSVSGLVEFARDMGPGIYGPAVVHMDNPGLLEAAWGRLTWSHVLTSLKGKNAPVSESPWNRPGKDVILLGSVMLIHRDIIDAGIMFDPLYFMYHEEVDFIYRAGKNGYPSFYCPSIRVRHYIGRGIEENPLKKIYWTRRNSIYFLKKQGASPGKWAKCLGTMLLSFLYTSASLRFRRARAIAAGALDGLRGFSENTLENLQKNDRK
jgi:GT2 family glycosyltransferase